MQWSGRAPSLRGNGRVGPETKCALHQVDQGDTGTTDWTRMRIDRVDISNEKDAMGQIRIVVLPTRKGAWKGQVRVDRIRVLKMPQLSIALNRPIHLYRQGEAVEVTCNASGLIANVPDIELYVVDQYLQTIEQISLPIQQTGKAPLPTPSQNPGPSGVKLASKNSDATVGWKGTAKWIIPPLQPGFYTVRCVLARSTSGIPFTRDTTFCILPKDDINAGDRRFGWSFADRDQGIPLAQLPNFLQLSSIRGAKIPIWIDSNDEKASEEQSWLIEKLKAQDIDIVGVCGYAA